MEILIRDLKIASYLLTVLTMLRRIVQKAKSKQSSSLGDLDYSLEKTQAADHMVSVVYSEALRDASSKRKEACERMAAAITANQLKMPGGAEELRKVLGGGANIPFASSEVFIGIPSNGARLATREVSACISEKKEYVAHPIYHNTEDTLSESGGSDDYLPF